jgi:hypothetical protein
VATNNLEEESPPKRLGFEDAGDSGDEDLIDDSTEETPTADAPSQGQADVDALTLVRIKGKKQVLADYQNLFDKDEEGSAFDAEGATEDQIDARIQDLSLLLSGKVLNSRGTTTDHAEAKRLNEDFTRRIEGIPFLRPKKKRPITDDGLTEGDSSLNDDPDHTSKKPRVITTVAKKRKTPIKLANSSSKTITMHFSPLQGKKDADDSQDTMGDDLPNGSTCGLCEEAKDTVCGICGLALCSLHSQEHSHGPRLPPTSILKTNLLGPETGSNKTVTFVEVVFDDVTLEVPHPSLVGAPEGPSEDVLLSFPKRHDDLDLVDTLNR